MFCRFHYWWASVIFTVDLAGTWKVHVVDRLLNIHNGTLCIGNLLVFIGLESTLELTPSPNPNQTREQNPSK